jgi:hypothetical protein
VVDRRRGSVQLGASPLLDGVAPVGRGPHRDQQSRQHQPRAEGHVGPPGLLALVLTEGGAHLPLLGGLAGHAPGAQPVAQQPGEDATEQDGHHQRQQLGDLGIQRAQPQEHQPQHGGPVDERPPRRQQIAEADGLCLGISQRSATALMSGSPIK